MASWESTIPKAGAVDDNYYGPLTASGGALPNLSQIPYICYLRGGLDARVINYVERGHAANLPDSSIELERGGRGRVTGSLTSTHLQVMTLGQLPLFSTGIPRSVPINSVGGEVPFSSGLRVGRLAPHAEMRRNCKRAWQ